MKGKGIHLLLGSEFGIQCRKRKHGGWQPQQRNQECRRHLCRKQLGWRGRFVLRVVQHYSPKRFKFVKKRRKKKRDEGNSPGNEKRKRVYEAETPLVFDPRSRSRRSGAFRRLCRFVRECFVRERVGSFPVFPHRVHQEKTFDILAVDLCVQCVRISTSNAQPRGELTFSKTRRAAPGLPRDERSCLIAAASFRSSWISSAVKKKGGGRT